jgi:hypothetical protein
VRRCVIIELAGGVGTDSLTIEWEFMIGVLDVSFALSWNIRKNTI